jgi:hypothetical protein
VGEDTIFVIVHDRSSEHARELDNRRDLDRAHVRSDQRDKRVPTTVTGSLSAPTLNHLNHDHHERDHQEDVNESAHGVGADKTEKPKDNQDDCNRVEHVTSPYLKRPRERAGLRVARRSPYEVTLPAVTVCAITYIGEIVPQAE